MKKSLIVIASALLLGVAATGTERLRYDSSVFSAGDQVTWRGRPTRDGYPPCVRGVREDRCIQLYERGVRSAYANWRRLRGGATARYNGRTYPVCRSRADDNCIQRVGERRVLRTARAAPTPAARAAALRTAPTTRARALPVAAARAVTPVHTSTQRVAVPQRSPTPRWSPTPRPRAPRSTSTPGI